MCSRQGFRFAVKCALKSLPCFASDVFNTLYIIAYWNLPSSLYSTHPFLEVLHQRLALIALIAKLNNQAGKETQQPLVNDQQTDES